MSAYKNKRVFSSLLCFVFSFLLVASPAVAAEDFGSEESTNEQSKEGPKIVENNHGGLFLVMIGFTAVLVVAPGVLPLFKEAPLSLHEKVLNYWKGSIAGEFDGDAFADSAITEF